MELAAYLTLAVSDGWEVIDITGFRKINKMVNVGLLLQENYKKNVKMRIRVKLI